MFLEPVVFDANERLASVRQLIARILGEAVEIAFDLAGEALPVETDPHQLEEAVVNLAVNARAAMPGGGRLTVRTARVELDPPRRISRAAPGWRPAATR